MCKNYRILKLFKVIKLLLHTLSFLTLFGLNLGDKLSYRHSSKVENSTLHFKIVVWSSIETAVEDHLETGHIEVLHNSYTTPTHLEWSPQVRGQSRQQWRHPYTHLSVKPGGQSRLQYKVGGDNIK